MSQSNADQVLVHAPYGRDGALICHFLAQAGIAAECCPTIEVVCAQLDENTGAALISDESLTPSKISAVTARLMEQPPWSDIPLIITTSGGEATVASRKRLEILVPLANFTLLERPLKAATLISAVRTALRARQRQYQLREHLRERDRLLQELERSNLERAQFAHVVSHDLQAPLRMVNVYSELLARRYRGQLDTTADEFIRTIQDGASTMETLIRTLLNYATVGQEPMTRKRVGLGSIVDAVVTTLQPAIDELKAEVSHSNLPTVRGDRVLLQQLIQNLIGNALKYRGSTAPRVKISAHISQNEWEVAVHDNGAGIAVEYHETIFLPLKLLHGAEISGTGMGLAVCKKIVERHGGRIWVESRLGMGSTFFFTLPAIERDEKPGVAVSVRQKENSAAIKTEGIVPHTSGRHGALPAQSVTDGAPPSELAP